MQWTNHPSINTKYMQCVMIMFWIFLIMLFVCRISSNSVIKLVPFLYFVWVQNKDRACVKSKKQLGRVVLASWWLKWSKIITENFWTAKTSSNSGYCQPKHLHASARNCHFSLSHHRKTTPVKISFEYVD